MNETLSRRQMLRAATAASVAMLGSRQPRRRRTEVHRGRAEGHQPRPGVLSRLAHVCRRKTGELIVTWSGGREGHVCPFGRVEMMTSKDGGDDLDLSARAARRCHRRPRLRLPRDRPRAR